MVGDFGGVEVIPATRSIDVLATRTYLLQTQLAVWFTHYSLVPSGEGSRWLGLEGFSGSILRANLWQKIQ
jgi:hypothetical protein